MPRHFLACAAAWLPLLAAAQPAAGWQSCAAVADGAQRLACYDAWAAGQQPPAAPPAAAATTPQSPAAPTVPAEAAAAVARAGSGLRLTAQEGCHDARHSELTRFWELARDGDCGIFGLRSYRPMVAALAVADTVNRQPTSENPANNATRAIDYRTREVRLQLSVRSKLAANLLTPAGSDASDSVWFAYSQQSYWQLFTPGISRPFRSTDHEPELMYVYPLSAQLAGWNLRYGGLGIVHHSNGQSLPYSRSWNRLYLMAGAERGPFTLQARLWRRIDEDRADDDNPRISDYYGRAQLQASWRPNDRHRLLATVRHSLASSGRGSVRLEWFRTLWDSREGPAGGLQLHTQLFTGYGDTLLDYNRKRTVFTIGVSLADW